MDWVRLLGMRGTNGDGAPVRVHLGSWTERMPVRRQGDDLFVPADLFRRWPMLREGRTIGLWEGPGGNDLHLGPCVGIIWDGPGKRRRAGPEGLLPEEREQLRHLAIGAGEAHALPFIFSITKVSLKNRTVKAMVPAGTEELLYISVPLPDVLYNRGTYPDLKLRRKARRLRQHMERVLGIPAVNSIAGFKKWNTYLALRFFPQTRDLVPEAILLGDRSSLTAFVKRHQRVFVKADGGSWGREVLSVDAGPSFAPGCRVKGYLRSKPVSRTLPHVNRLHGFLRTRMSKDKWIVQRAIGRATLFGRYFDLRVVLQKDDRAVWQIPHVLVNWAHRGEVVTNRMNRADFLTAEEFMGFWGGDAPRFAAMVAAAGEAAHRIAHVLEARFGVLGELGLDIGLDETGRPWLFEANAKPFFFPGEGNRYPFLYARHLAVTSWEARYKAGSNAAGSDGAGADAGRRLGNG